MVELIEKDELLKSLKQVTIGLQSLFADGQKVFRLPDGSIVTSSTLSDVPRLSAANNIENVVRSMFLSSLEKAERIGPNSSKILIDFVSALINDNVSYEAVESYTKDVLNNIKTVDVASYSHIENALRSAVPKVSDLILEAMILAGGECKIFVESSSRCQPSVELVSGFNFSCQPSPLFFKNQRWMSSYVRCLIVDGIVDKVSEIDSLLQRCNADRAPMIIFARGFSSDIQKTLHVNFLRKTLNVIPVTVKFNLETANVLLDIAAALGTDVISSLKGELISTVLFDDLRLANIVTCTGNNVNIMASSGDSLSAHIKNLTKKRAAETIPAVKQILDNRIKSLSSMSVIIRVDDSGPEGHTCIADIDLGLKIVRSALERGVLTDVQFSTGTHSLASVAAGIKLGASLYKSFLSTNLAIIEPSS